MKKPRTRSRSPAGRALRVFVWTVTLLVSALMLGRVALAPDPATPAGTRTALAQLAYLENDLEERADRMQDLFPEGRVFTLALYGLTWVDIGRAATDQATRARALAEARRALALAEAPRSLEGFEPASGLPLGVFYEGWIGHLRAGTLHLAGGAAADTAFRGTCARLDSAFQRHGPFLDSYPGDAWPADNAAGAAVLRSCGTLLDPRYTRAAEAWLRAALARADPATGLIPHAAWSPQPRGESAALMIRFIAEIDPAAAAAQYERFERTFATRFAAVLPAVREYPHGVSGEGDVDSGPIILGVSAPASVVGVAAARMVGRPAAAADLRAAPEVLGMPLQWGGRRSYAFGELPVGDAFLAWVTVVRPRNQPAPPISPGSPYAGWRWMWMLIWGVILALSVVRLVMLLPRREKAKPA
ncbi:MAG TPA: hypothetical protein VFS20_26615 [Longimicrobium sp.]|nr:hypothetical protein [Longimicrobium sp.]